MRTTPDIFKPATKFCSQVSIKKKSVEAAFFAVFSRSATLAWKANIKKKSKANINPRPGGV